MALAVSSWNTFAQGVPSSSPLSPPAFACADSQSWSDDWGDGCDWYADNDPGCTEYDDHGQQANCLSTCGRCSPPQLPPSPPLPPSRPSPPVLPSPSPLSPSPPASPPPPLPPPFVITGGCSALSGVLDHVEYVAAGYTALGSPFYRGTRLPTPSAIERGGLAAAGCVYWDPDCDGDSSSARWIVDDRCPNTTASNDLDGDGGCSYYARIDSDDSSSPPLGAETWRAYCDSAWTDNVLTLAHPSPAPPSLPSPPSSPPTPPTSPPPPSSPPLPPSSPPPPPSPPTPPPSPLLPFLAGEVLAFLPEDIQKEINRTAAGGHARVYLVPGTRYRFHKPITCDSNIRVSVRSSREGATLDGEKHSNMFRIMGGCVLDLEALHFVDGRSRYHGGAIFAYGAGDISMRDVSFTGCEADNGARRCTPIAWSHPTLSLPNTRCCTSGRRRCLRNRQQRPLGCWCNFHSVQG